MSARRTKGRARAEFFPPFAVSPEQRKAGRALAAQVADAIEAAPPGQFFQRIAVHWVAERPMRSFAAHWLPDRMAGRREAPCGLPAGVEGWTCAVIDEGDTRPVAQRPVRRYGAGEVARRALALDEAEAERMFDPAPFGGYDEASAGDAAAMLRRYAAGGSVTWTKEGAQGALDFEEEG